MPESHCGKWETFDRFKDLKVPKCYLYYILWLDDFLKIIFGTVGLCRKISQSKIKPDAAALIMFSYANVPAGYLLTPVTDWAFNKLNHSVPPNLQYIHLHFYLLQNHILSLLFCCHSKQFCPWPSTVCSVNWTCSPVSFLFCSRQAAFLSPFTPQSPPCWAFSSLSSREETP